MGLLVQGSHLGDADVVVLVLDPVQTDAGHGGVGHPAAARRQGAAADLIVSLRTPQHTTQLHVSMVSQRQEVTSLRRTETCELLLVMHYT